MVDQADLEIYQGDDYAATVLVLDAEGNAPDLSGYTAQAQVRLTPADPAIIDMETSVEPPNNIVLRASAEQTALLKYEHYVWDLQLTSPEPDTTITTLMSGRANVTLQVTR